MFSSIKARVIAIVSGIIICAFSLSSILLSTWTETEVTSIFEEQAFDLLESIRTQIKSHDRDIKLYETSMLNRRKQELRHSTTIVLSLIRMYYNKYINNEMNLAEAQSTIISFINATRYDDGKGYFWINDTDKPFPRMIVHPTIPGLNGTVLDDPEFNCALGRDENLFKAFVDLTEVSNGNYVDYFWPKPIENGLTSKQPKISYVERFPPWNWIVGTGVYIDDLQKDVANKYNQVINLLNTSLQTLRIDEFGYFFVYTGDGTFIAHPSLKGDIGKTLRNPVSGNLILDELRESQKKAETDVGIMEYLWDKPGDEGNFAYPKKAFTVYYEPLDWYISVSVYKTDIQKRVSDVTGIVLWGTLSLLVMSLITVLLLIRSINKPINRLIKSIENRNKSGMPEAKLPLQDIHEIDIITNAINKMITAIVQSKEQISESEARYRYIFENSGDAIVLLDKTCCIDCNTSALTLFGKTKAELMGACFDFEIPQYIERAEAGENVFFQWTYTKSDNTEIIADVSLYLVELPKKHYIQAIIRDITERKKIQEMMIQSEKMLSVGGLAAGMAHEINNPLAGMIQTAYNLANRLENNNERTQKTNVRAAEQAGIDLDALHKYNELRKIPEMLQSLIDSGSRISDIIGNMLSFSRKDSQQKTTCSVNELIIQTLELVATDYNIKKKYDFKNIKIIKQFAENLPLIPMEKSKIQQVLLNLFRNGAEAMTEAKTESPEFSITTSLASELNRVQIEIKDNGPGMNEDTRKRVFEPFYTTKAVGVGTGLGLSVSYFIITDDHKGEMFVESAVGKGCNFIIRLPI